MGNFKSFLRSRMVARVLLMLRAVCPAYLRQFDALQ
jgi:hypothetical protein